MNNRARIFLPMDALRGFKEALQEKETLKEERKILLEDEQILLSNQLLNLKENLSVLIKYYDICNYQVIKGKITNINYTYKYLYVDNTKINFNDIINIVLC